MKYPRPISLARSYCLMQWKSPRPFLFRFAALMLVMAVGPMGVRGQNIEQHLKHEISSSAVVEQETIRYLESRIPPMPQPSNLAEWEAMAQQMREQALARVVYRGEAAKWRHIRGNVEWLGSMEGGPEYRIRKLRFEAWPGMWIPALLYEPLNLTGKRPVALSVNGHDPVGKAAPYKQIRCINLAKRGMIVLNVEWFHMGQLRVEGNAHSRLNQIDLCGTSGLAPFYLSMKRSLDILLDHPNADLSRVAVSGLSGGGWQTILISALDTRVTLSNPVAGYSSFLTRIHNQSDLGDSEQTPVDLGAVSDYAQLTALLAPRAALLTYNVKDDCCFASAHALPPLLAAAEPIYKLYGKIDRLRSHVNYEPGTHNFEKDNRQAMYGMVRDHFYADDPAFSADEIECQSEVKTAEQLHVELPAGNATLQSVAMSLAKSLPRDGGLPNSADAAAAWSQSRREELKKLVAAKDYSVAAQVVGDARDGDVQVTFWRLRIGDVWTVPAVELARDNAQGAVVVVNDGGRKGATQTVAALLQNGQRVFAIDPFYFGESQFASRASLWAYLIATVEDRPLGLQASQVAAVARWLKTDRAMPSVTLAADGERSSLFSLVAAAIEPQSIDALRCTSCLATLKEVLEKNYTGDQYPELFSFGLLERFDIKQLVATIAPRTVTLQAPSERARQELAELKGYYQLSGKPFSPVE